ncbi:MAG TPA: glycosyltransferase family 39 protein [Dictyobacter sp.]|jgi:4-amino-4-deoxy-L-arabinose transferase-like glycosyltransferase|nr:glycosyltransferase family 39 protein [Dictyobacter sp.]
MNTFLTQSIHQQKKYRGIWIGLLILLFFVVALLLRLHTLNVTFDRDSYDEGVYWQTLRSWTAGNPLYGKTFYSQPPVFMYAVYPFYLLGGQTIWGARLGVAIMSMVGLVGALCLGKALRGWLGAIIAALLLLIDPRYLSTSQVLQAEGVQVPLTLLAVGCAYLWWSKPTTRSGMIAAGVCTISLVAAILSKLFAVGALVPVFLLAVHQLWRSFHQPAPEKRAILISLLIAIICAILATIICLAPIFSSWSQFWNQAIGFHESAKSAPNVAPRLHMILQALNTPVSYIALVSTLIALWKRDWRILPLLAWFVVMVVILHSQKPLFPHHLVELIPILVALAIPGLQPLQEGLKELFQLQPFKEAIKKLRNFNGIASLLLALMILVSIVLNARTIRYYYKGIIADNNSPATQENRVIAQSLQSYIKPGELVITDAQFTLAMGNRSTPPYLVDTSSVRITTGDVTAQELITTASEPQVQGVMIAYSTERLDQVPQFDNWVHQHLHLVQKYSDGTQLWIK